MDSTFKVPFTTILAINPHPSADRLEIATVYGFQVVFPKNKFVVGSKVIYIPVDSIITPAMEALLFSSDSKIKLNNSRIRQIRIRKFPSQGMIVAPDEIKSIVNTDYLELEQDLMSILGIQKYEPIEKGPSQTLGKLKKSRKNLEHPNFHSYNGLPNMKWMPNLFEEGEHVVIQEKLHGTNARAAKLPFRANTTWKKIKQYFGCAPKYENVYGSNRVDITNATTYKGYYGEDIYGKTFEKLGVFGKIPPHFTVFGEIIGPGIQKGYEYSLKEHEFVVFDVKVLKDDGTQEWLTPTKVQIFASKLEFKFVPVLYEGPYNKALLETLVQGSSTFDVNEKVKEGIVIKSAINYSIDGNKKAVKMLNPEYLDNKDNSDFH